MSYKNNNIIITTKFTYWFTYWFRKIITDRLKFLFARLKRFIFGSWIIKNLNSPFVIQIRNESDKTKRVNVFSDLRTQYGQMPLEINKYDMDKDGISIINIGGCGLTNEDYVKDYIKLQQTMYSAPNYYRCDKIRIQSSKIDNFARSILVYIFGNKGSIYTRPFHIDSNRDAYQQQTDIVDIVIYNNPIILDYHTLLNVEIIANSVITISFFVHTKKWIPGIFEKSWKFITSIFKRKQKYAIAA